ncbi:hypothetical protein [Actinoallomurus sp. CA-150999]|uniref:hypothetical protein n=1 Tax=Actinoallomurus sp. CA-150999 TaxID=3239887 RepID=UPI003D8C266F
MPSAESSSFQTAMMPTQPVQESLRRFRIFPDRYFQLLDLGDLRDALKPQPHRLKALRIEALPGKQSVDLLAEVAKQWT